MHDGFTMDPMDMKVEHQYSLHPHESHDFGPDQMVDIAREPSPPHNNSSPPNDYGSFDFSAGADSMYNRPFQPHFSAPQSLHLNTSTSTLWPSQITNPSEHSSPPMSLPIHRSIAPVTQSVPAPVPPAAAPTRSGPSLPTSRRTLSDDDRRRMCKYHDEHPSVKQTEIGAMFGVERSTVSKVLRNKEKYLVPEDGSRSPVKRSKSKFPDIERTLLNWVKNRMADGLPVSDDLIKDEARKFASTLGSAESHGIVNDPVWLEKFKTKNNLPGAKSRDAKAEKESLSPTSKSGSQTPNGVSPTVGWDGMPINQAKDEFKTKSPDSYYDSSSASTAWGHTHSQSTASLGSVFSDVTIASSSYTGDFRSPSSPYFSPMSSCGPSPAMPAQKTARLPPLAPASSLRRRQTVPLVGSESSPDSPTSKNALNTNLEPQPEQMEISPLGIDSSMQHSRPNTTIPTPMTNNHSPLSMAPPSGPAGSSPTASPSKDDARDALRTLMDYMRRCPEGTIDPHDYIVMGKLMQMLKLEGGGLPGGMHSIPLGSERVSMTERADGTAPMGRKRSEHSLS